MAEGFVIPNQGFQKLEASRKPGAGPCFERPIHGAHREVPILEPSPEELCWRWYGLASRMRRVSSLRPEGTNHQTEFLQGSAENKEKSRAYESVITVREDPPPAARFLALRGAVQVLTCFSTVFLGHLQTFPAEASFFPAPAGFILTQGLHCDVISFNTLQLSQQSKWRGVFMLSMGSLAFGTVS